MHTELWSASLQNSYLDYSDSHSFSYYRPSDSTHVSGPMPVSDALPLARNKAWEVRSMRVFWSVTVSRSWLLGSSPRNIRANMVCHDKIRVMLNLSFQIFSVNLGAIFCKWGYLVSCFGTFFKPYLTDYAAARSQYSLFCAFVPTTTLAGLRRRLCRDTLGGS